MVNEKPKRRRSLAPLLVAGVCWTIGVALFLLGTEGLSRTSETALVQGSWGLIPFLVAGGGAFIGRRGPGWAILFASIFLTAAAITLGLFFGVLWDAL